MTADRFPETMRARIATLTEARRDRVLERACIIHEACLCTWEEACERALNEQK